MSIEDESFPNDDLFDKLNDDNGDDDDHQVHQTIASNTMDGECSAEESYIASVSTSTSCKTSDSEPISELNQRRDHDNDDRKYKSTKKAWSTQNLHSEYTKRKFQHVTSKVAQYIAEINAQDELRRKKSKFQRHCSVPDTLTATVMRHESHYSTGDLRSERRINHHHHHGDDECSFNEREESYDQILRENARLLKEHELSKAHISYLQSSEKEKCNENFMLKQNIEMMRIDMSDLSDKLKRQQAMAKNNLHYLTNYHNYRHHEQSSSCFPPITRSTQTDGTINCCCNISNVTVTTPPPTTIPLPPLLLPSNADSNDDDDDDSSTGSIEMILLSAGPPTPLVAQGAAAVAAAATTINKRPAAIIQPVSLNFSNDNSANTINSNSNSNSNSSSNSSSQQISNDSAIEMQTIDTMTTRAQTRNYLRYQTRYANANINGTSHTHTHAPSRAHATSSFQFQSNDSNNISLSSIHSHGGRTSIKKKRSLGALFIKIFGPCARCKDPNPVNYQLVQQ